MDTGLFQSKTTVAEALQKDPHIFKVFIQSKTACVGCYLARFCTLRDVAEIYGLEMDHFLGQLEHAIPSNPPGIQKEFKNEKRI